MEQYDIVVIGAGPGGYPAAIRAAQLGAKTAIIEKEAIGGTCLNRGCIPAKTLILSANLYNSIENADQFGITTKNASMDLAGLMKHKNSVIDQLKGGVAQLLKANGVDVYDGVGSFKTRNVIAIAGDNPVEIKADKVIIASGSVPVVPSFIPKHDRVMDSRAFLDIEELPPSLIVLGGGYIGCELACMAAQLGSEVTIVELLDDILVAFDSDVRAEIRQHMEKELGMTILTGKAMEKVEATDSAVIATVGGDKIEADAMLVSIGRKPAADDLALENAGLALNDKGFLEVDEYNRTKAASIFAVGDVNGGIMLAHVATSEALIAAEIACGKTPRKNETVVPAVIFSKPEASCAGLTEQQAAEEGIDVNVGKFAFRGLGRAIAVSETDGFVKWISDAETDQLLGAAAVGPHACDLIAEAALAIRNELTVTELGQTIHAHPTMTEIWMEAAHAVHGEAIHAAPVKR